MRKVCCTLLLLCCYTVFAQEDLKSFTGKWKYDMGAGQTKEYIFKKNNVVTIQTITKSKGSKSTSAVEGKASIDTAKNILSIFYFDMSFNRISYKFSYKFINDKTVELRDLSDTTLAPVIFSKS